MSDARSGKAVPNGSPATGDRGPIFTLLFTTLVSTLSNNLTSLAIPWFILTLTGSVEKMGIVAAATMLPQALMAAFGGAIADRMSPRRLSIVSDLLSAISVALIPLLHARGALSFGLLLALCVAGAVFDGPGYAGRTKMIPRLAELGSISLERVNSITGTFHAMSMIAGTLLGGVLIAFMGASNVLWINAVAFVISVIAMLWRIPDVHVPREETPSFVEDFREGIAFIRKMPLLVVAIPMALVLNMLVAPVIAVLIPYFAKTEWDSPQRLGLIMSGFGFGVLAGSLAYGSLGQKARPSTLMRISMALFALPLWLLVPLPAWHVAWVSMVAVGAGAGIVNPMFTTIVMRATPPDLLGRVNGVIGAGAMIASPLGVLIASPLVGQLGLSWTFGWFALAALTLPIAALVINVPALMDHLRGDAESPDSTEYMPDQERTMA